MLSAAAFCRLYRNLHGRPEVAVPVAGGSAGRYGETAYAPLAEVRTSTSGITSDHQGPRELVCGSSGDPTWDPRPLSRLESLSAGSSRRHSPIAPRTRRRPLLRVLREAGFRVFVRSRAHRKNPRAA